MQARVVLLAALLGVAVTGSVWAADAPGKAVTLKWDDLVPAGAPPPDFSAMLKQDAKPPPDLFAAADPLTPSAPGAPVHGSAGDPVIRNSTYGAASARVVKALDGKRVRLPGYVVPLDNDGLTTTEFLLVPYFGACIHVPPPPANQIVLMRSKKPIRLPELSDAIWAEGVLHTEYVSSGLADAGYTMEVERTEEYEE
jgi:uncharacterized protein